MKKKRIYNVRSRHYAHLIKDLIAPAIPRVGTRMYCIVWLQNVLNYRM